MGWVWEIFWLFFFGVYINDVVDSCSLFSFWMKCFSLDFFLSIRLIPFIVILVDDNFVLVFVVFFSVYVIVRNRWFSSVSANVSVYCLSVYAVLLGHRVEGTIAFLYFSCVLFCVKFSFAYWFCFFFHSFHWSLCIFLVLGVWYLSCACECLFHLSLLGFWFGKIVWKSTIFCLYCFEVWNCFLHFPCNLLRFNCLLRLSFTL